MTDFITTITNGSSTTAFANLFWANVPATVPVGDRYICEIGTENLVENLVMNSRIINGDIIVRAVAGQVHNGKRGTGISVGRTSGSNENLLVHDCTGTGQIIVEDLEIRYVNTVANAQSQMIAPTAANTPLAIVRRCLITNVNSLNTRPIALDGFAEGDLHLISNRFWDESGLSTLRLFNAFFGTNQPSARTLVIQGNTWQVTGGAIQRGVQCEIDSNAPSGAVIDVQGNIVLGAADDFRVSDLGAIGASFTFIENGSEDLTGQITGVSVATDFVSVEDPDLKTGSILLEQWPAEPITFGAELDIRNNNRTVVGGLADWDIGSMQFSVTALPPPTASGNITRPLVFSNIFSIIRDVAPDISFETLVTR